MKLNDAEAHKNFVIQDSELDIGYLRRAIKAKRGKDPIPPPVLERGC